MIDDGSGLTALLRFGWTPTLVDTHLPPDEFVREPDMRPSSESSAPDNPRVPSHEEWLDGLLDDRIAAEKRKDER